MSFAKAKGKEMTICLMFSPGIRRKTHDFKSKTIQYPYYISPFQNGIY